MKKAGPDSNLKLSLPTQEVTFAKFLTQSGTFKDGDLLVNKDGLRIVPQEDEHVPPLIQPLDNQLTLADIDTIKVIGKGSGGIVQLVRHKWTGQFFALKVIQMNTQETVRKQIVQELKINQSAQCPYVVVCYHSFYDNGSIYIVLEYMDGGSLADFIRKVKSIPESYLSAICKQARAMLLCEFYCSICLNLESCYQLEYRPLIVQLKNGHMSMQVLKGLIYLHHEKHIIHRDIKPSNLLINHRGEVKITDFGVSAVLASSTGQRDTFVGTYNYMSPERISGGTYGHKSDIWSLGLALLECATGCFPYSPPEEEREWLNFYELLEAIVDQPPPCAPPDQFSPEFCSFISACVQKDSKDRHSAQSLLNHLFITKYADQDVDLASYFTNVGSPLSTFQT